MKVSIKDITPQNVKDIPEPCRTCLYWEALGGKQPSQTEKARYVEEKAAWFLKMLHAFGSCGKILYVDGKPVGYAQYSTAEGLPNAREYGAEKLGTAEENVAFISCLYIADASLRGKGLGEKLLNEVIADLKRRGFKAVETFARRSWANNPSGPIEFYLRRGFKVKEELKTDPDFALMRLDL